jgi:hypothetical protein
MRRRDAVRTMEADPALSVEEAAERYGLELDVSE